MSETTSPVRGFFRVAIRDEDGEIVGDSGFQQNQITLQGYAYFLCNRLAGSGSNTNYVSHVALGTGGVPASDATTLAGEVVKRAAVTAALSNTSKTMRFTGTFASADSFVTNTQNISNIGLFSASTAGSMFSGNTFASSSCAVNQSVNVTYDIVFS